MSKRKKMKPVKAWALVGRNFGINPLDCLFTKQQAIEYQKECIELGDEPGSTKIVRVLISEISPRPKPKARKR